MKKHLLFLVFAFLGSFSIFAQAPNLINYQGLALDNNGNPLPNQTIALQLSILDNSPTGSDLYKETHSTTTNNLGVFNVKIGGGTASLGSIDAINWGAAARFLKVEMDPNGGNVFQLIGSSQLVSVPYALYAERVNPANLPKTFDYGLRFFASNSLGRDSLIVYKDPINYTNAGNVFASWFGGPEEKIKITLENLPPGVMINPLPTDPNSTIKVELNAWSFYLMASPDAVPGAYTLTIKGVSLATQVTRSITVPFYVKP